MYEGRPINKLQSGVILLIFKIWKIRDTSMRFVGRLFPNTTCEFYYDDVITMTSLALWTQSVRYFTHHYSFQLDETEC